MGKKILVVAYAVSPTRGSEYSVAWNYLTEMSKDNEIVVLYGVSGDHMGDIDEMEAWLSTNLISNVRFVPVLPNKITTRLNILNQKGIFPYAFYLAFNFWQRQIYLEVEKIIKHEKFDLIHNLNPIGYREPGYLWKLDLPYIWGPIGGIPNRPSQLFKDLNLKSRIFFTIRNWVNTIQFKFNSRLKQALKKTDLLLTATSENKDIVLKEYNVESIHISENGIVESDFNRALNCVDLKEGETLNIVWIGTIDERKSINFLIEALIKIKNQNWHLHILGQGPMKEKMQQRAIEMQINDKLTWHGHVERSKVLSLLQSIHLHIITSLGEATTTVLFEAMTNGIPTITLNHCGMKDVVCDKCGVKIGINSVEQIKNDLASTILNFIENPKKVNDLSKGVAECMELHTWKSRRLLFNSYYDIAIENWKRKKQ
jgi:glycosyltransferase involved in cell wall biosynthesis